MKPSRVCEHGYIIPDSAKALTRITKVKPYIDLNICPKSQLPQILKQLCSTRFLQFAFPCKKQSKPYTLVPFCAMCNEDVYKTKSEFSRLCNFKSKRTALNGSVRQRGISTGAA